METQNLAMTPKIFLPSPRHLGEGTPPWESILKCGVTFPDCLVSYFSEAIVRFQGIKDLQTPHTVTELRPCFSIQFRKGVTLWKT